MIKVLAAFVLAAIFTGQVPESTDLFSVVAETFATETTALTPAARFDQLYEEKLAALTQKNVIGLTNAQMLEDYDALYQTLQENYPYFGVAKRKAGVDFTANYQAGRARLANCKTDVDFYLEVSRLINSMQGIGHLNLYDAATVQAELEEYQKLQKSGLPEERQWEKPWMEDFTSAPVVKYAAAWDALLTPAYREAYKQTMKEFQMEAPTTENVTTKIIEEGKTAYLSIASFDMGAYEKDKETIFSVYEQIASYENLIIDITENGGGGMGYYMDLLVAPNIEQPVYWLNYVFMKDGAILHKYHPDIQEAYFALDTPASVIKHTILQRYPAEQQVEPYLQNVGIPPKMNKEDLKSLDLYSPSLMSIDPLDGKKRFQGKIWVLVSDKVYSSSESFASFCKTTGFATLVGTRTGGDGIGSDPLLFVLPNSGLVGRFAWIYGTVQDGTGSEEFGTVPDIETKPGETALEACLHAIA